MQMSKAYLEKQYHEIFYDRIMHVIIRNISCNATIIEERNKYLSGKEGTSSSITRTIPGPLVRFLDDDCSLVSA